MDFRGGTAAARRCISFMRNENCLWRYVSTRNVAARFGFGHQALHHLANVLDIETSTVESAVSGLRGQHLADRLYSSFARRVGALYNQGGGTHADNHAVPPAVEGSRGICNHLVGGSRPTCQKACAHPIDQMVGADIVSRDDDYPAAAPG